MVFLTFSSHGYTDPTDGGFYIFPHDLGQDSAEITPDFLHQHCISSDELTSWLRGVDVAELVLIVDTCHAAAAVDAKGDFKAGPMGSRGLGQLAYDKCMWILTASQAGDVAVESGHIRQGLLTYALVRDGLEKKRAEFNGQITLGGWLQFAEARVPVLYSEVLAGTVRDADGKSASAVRPIISNEAQEYSRQVRPITLGATPVVQVPRLFQYARNKQGIQLNSETK